MKVVHIRQKRYSGPKYWIAKIYVLDDLGDAVFSCVALEDRKKCPPAGTWKLRLEWSPKFKRNLYEMKGIPGRSEIKYHYGNTLDDTDGCPLLGQSYYRATVSHSVAALNQFMRTLSGEVEPTVEISEE